MRCGWGGAHAEAVWGWVAPSLPVPRPLPAVTLGGPVLHYRLWGWLCSQAPGPASWVGEAEVNKGKPGCSPGEEWGDGQCPGWRLRGMAWVTCPEWSRGTGTTSAITMRCPRARLFQGQLAQEANETPGSSHSTAGEGCAEAMGHTPSGAPQAVTESPMRTRTLPPCAGPQKGQCGSHRGRGTVGSALVHCRGVPDPAGSRPPPAMVGRVGGEARPTELGTPSL